MQGAGLSQDMPAEYPTSRLLNLCLSLCQLLLDAVSRHGEKNWWKIRLEVPGRTDSACRDR